MNTREATVLLAKVVAYDRRSVGRADTEAWADAMTRANVSLPDAMEGVSQHFAESPNWLMPAHVIGQVKTLHRQRVANVGRWELPADLHQAQERAWLAVFWDAVKSGVTDPQSVADVALDIRRPELPAADLPRLMRVLGGVS